MQSWKLEQPKILNGCRLQDTLIKAMPKKEKKNILSAELEFPMKHGQKVFIQGWALQDI